MKDFEDLSSEEKIRVHEAEMRQMKSDIQHHEELIVALLEVVAPVLASAPGGNPEGLPILKRLIAERAELRSRRDPWYYR